MAAAGGWPLPGDGRCRGMAAVASGSRVDDDARVHPVGQYGGSPSEASFTTTSEGSLSVAQASANICCSPPFMLL
jgi:hypothetical protein